MRFEDTNTYFVEMLLNVVSELDAWRFAEAFPEHEEAVDAHWKSRKEIVVNDMSSWNIIDKVLEQCNNLTSFTTRRYIHLSSYHLFNVLNALAKHCPSLENLDIPEILLTDEILNMDHSLTALTKLKRISIFMYKTTSGLKKLFINNPQLESICLKGGIFETITWSSAIPKTIKTFEYCGYGCDRPNRSLFATIELWQLEKLVLNDTLTSTENLQSLYSQKSLVSLTLTLDGGVEDIYLEPLFNNNPRLEEVRLTSVSQSLDGRCLRKLNKTLKKLELNLSSKINYECLIDCLKVCNIEELHLTDHLNELLPLLPTIAPNLKVLDIKCTDCSGSALSSLKFFQKLEVLVLRKLTSDHDEALIEITQNCLRLEKLRLKADRNFLAFELKVFQTVAALPQLKELYLKSIKFSENSFKLLNGLLKIEQLTFNSCSGLTFAHFLELAKCRTTLTSLRILKNGNISESLVIQTAKELRKQKYVTTLQISNGKFK